MRELIFPLRVMQRLGAHSLLVTNAAGGVNSGFTQGELMLITDHINHMGDNPVSDDRLVERRLCAHVCLLALR